jgi:hypothetical protein
VGKTVTLTINGPAGQLWWRDGDDATLMCYPEGSRCGWRYTPAEATPVPMARAMELLSRLNLSLTGFVVEPGQ